MTVSGEKLREWVRILTPGQADLCTELLAAREVIGAVRWSLETFPEGIGALEFARVLALYDEAAG